MQTPPVLSTIISFVGILAGLKRFKNLKMEGELDHSIRMTFDHGAL